MVCCAAPGVNMILIWGSAVGAAEAGVSVGGSVGGTAGSVACVVTVLAGVANRFHIPMEVTMAAVAMAIWTSFQLRFAGLADIILSF